MITLRDLTRSDKAIGSITSEECKLISKALDWSVTMQNSWWLRRMMPQELKDKALAIRMLAATLSRTPEERQPCLNEQIRLSMKADKKCETPLK